MNLEESDKFLEKQRKKEQKRRIVLISIATCGVLAALLVIMIIYIQYQDSLKLKLYIDGVQKNISKELFRDVEGENYVDIKAFAEMLGYTYTKGDYKKYNENESSCYIKNDLEVVAMSADSDTFVKYIEVVPKTPVLSVDGPYGTAITVASEDGESNTFIIEKPVVQIENRLYVPFEYLNNVYNVVVDTSTENRIRVYTLPVLFQNAQQIAARLQYTTISGVYENIRALADGLIVVGNNGIYGVINASSGEEILSVKYENLEFLQNVKEFFMSAENTVGLLDKDGNTIIQPKDYDEISILDEVQQLYLVKKDKQYGVLNREGEVVVHLDYDKIGFDKFEEFEIENARNSLLIFNKCIVVELDDKYGLYSVEGKELLKPVYEGFGYKSEGTEDDSVLLIPKEEFGIEGIVINFNGLYGIYDITSEQLVLPAVYSKIYSVTKGGKTTYYAMFGDTAYDVKDLLKSISSGNEPEEEFIEE